MPRLPTAAAALVLMALVPAGARAADDDPRCDGTHALWSPLPDACLEVIDTDRPHQTDTPHVVPAGHTQVESALVQVQAGGLLGAPTSERGPRLILFDDNYKFGLFSGIDVQLLFVHASYDPGTASFAPPGPFSVRAKFNVVAERGWVPSMSLVPWVFLPVAPSQPLRGGPLVFWGWELPAHFELEVNAGVLFGAWPKPPAAVVLASALTYTMVGDFRVFADIYATGPDIALGTGALWAFTRDAQIDLGTYIGLNGDEPVATPFVGLSVRR